MNLIINFMPGVGWRAHFGGAVTGLLLIMILTKRQSMDGLRRNAILALAALSVISVVAIRQRSDLSKDDIYYLTDINVLAFESELGFTSYAGMMAKNLDRVYHSDYLEQVFR